MKTVKHEKVKSPAKVKTPEKKTPAKATSVSPVEESSAGPKKGSGYRAYLHREAPRSLGCKEVPEVMYLCSSDCLNMPKKRSFVPPFMMIKCNFPFSNKKTNKKSTFVITGVSESISHLMLTTSLLFVFPMIFSGGSELLAGSDV